MNTFILGYLVSHLYEAYTNEPGDKAKNSRTTEKVTKSSGTQPQSDHWQKQHDAIQKTSGDITPAFPEDGMPPDVISTITLPVWIRARKSPLYTSDDAEAKDYARIQSDTQKVDQLKKQVGQWMTTRLKNPIHEVNLRYIGFNGKIGLALHLVPQLHPPPLYEVPAIVIFKDGIGLGWKTLRPDLGSRMEAVFRPGVTYTAAKTSLKVFCLTSYAILKAKVTGGQAVVFNIKSAKPTSPVVSAKDIEKDNNLPSMASLPAGMNTATMQELIKVLHNGANTRERHSDLIKQLPLSTAVQLAAATFRQKQLHGIAHAQQARARGVLQVRGHVVCFGERGTYQLDVVAFYLPAEDKFLGPLTLNNAYVVKDFNQWQQLEQKQHQQLKKKEQDRLEAFRLKMSEQDPPNKTSSDEEKDEGAK